MRKYLSVVSKKVFIAAGIFLLFVFLFSEIALGALPAPRPPVSGSAVTLSEIIVIIDRVARFLIVTSVIVMAIAIIWAGVLWTTAGDSERKNTARAWLRNGIIGALIILGIGVILQTLLILVTRRDVFFY